MKIYLILSFCLLLSCKFDSNKSPQNEFRYNSEEHIRTLDNKPKVSLENLSCEKLLEIVTNNGDRKAKLNDSDMNSSALYYIELYEYQNVFYVVANFKNRKMNYIYCEIDMESWNAFLENSERSYGKGFQKWIKSSSHCGCE